jgi:hypothetical protein
MLEEDGTLAVPADLGLPLGYRPVDADDDWRSPHSLSILMQRARGGRASLAAADATIVEFAALGPGPAGRP